MGSKKMLNVFLLKLNSIDFYTCMELLKFPQTLPAHVIYLHIFYEYFKNICSLNGSKKMKHSTILMP